MEKFTHQQFIDDNHIDIATLPVMLKKRIQGFEELQADLEHTTEEDTDALKSKLERLSHELAEDLEEHFEDDLENNDIEEDEVEQPVEVQVTTEIPFNPETNDPLLETPQEEPWEEPLEPLENTEPVEEELTDEGLLDQLYTGNMFLVLPDHLIEMGFKTKLSDRNVPVGKYLLHKGKYDKRYTIALKK